jgi:hypothetical protein
MLHVGRELLMDDLSERAGPWGSRFYKPHTLEPRSECEVRRANALLARYVDVW